LKAQNYTHDPDFTVYTTSRRVQVLAGNRNTPTATVIIHDTEADAECQVPAIGTGPVDATFQAINAAVAGHAHSGDMKLLEYSVESVTAGIDALGEVSGAARRRSFGAARRRSCGGGGGSAGSGGSSSGGRRRVFRGERRWRMCRAFTTFAAAGSGERRRLRSRERRTA
jgi:uncharacterized membrane protein YgcG